MLPTGLSFSSFRLIIYLQNDLFIQAGLCHASCVLAFVVLVCVFKYCYCSCFILCEFVPFYGPIFSNLYSGEAICDRAELKGALLNKLSLIWLIKEGAARTNTWFLTQFQAVPHKLKHSKPVVW